LRSGSGGTGPNPNGAIEAAGSVNILTDAMEVFNTGGGGVQIISHALTSINIDVEQQLAISRPLNNQCVGLACLFVIDVPGASQSQRNNAINIDYGTLLICDGSTNCVLSERKDFDLFLDPPPVEGGVVVLPPPTAEEGGEAPDSLGNEVLALLAVDDGGGAFGDDEDGEEDSAFQCN
jgi:hypothetical protein